MSTQEEYVFFGRMDGMKRYTCLEFSGQNIPLVAYAEWDDAQRDGSLTICSRNEARALAESLPSDRRQAILVCIAKVPHADCESVTFNGDVALTLTSGLIGLQQMRMCGYNPDYYELLGFWEPPDHCEPGSGMFMWHTGDDGFVVEIVHSKEAALGTLHEMHIWLTPTRYGRLQDKIRRWNAENKSTQPSLRVDGVIGELLCKASVALKLKSALAYALN